MENLETSVRGTPTPELTTSGTCQISRSQSKAEVLKLHRIVRKTTNSSSFLGRTGLSRPQCKDGIILLMDSQHVQTRVNLSN